MPGLHIDKVGGGSSSPVVMNFLELITLKDEGKLIPGSEYLLTDYLHQYFIEGSDSSGKKTFYYNSRNVSGWAVLGYQYNLLVGTEVIVTELPEGYTGAIQVGDVTTVTNQSSYYYFMFANGLHWVVGARLMTAEDRYVNIPQDIEVNDANGKPVLRPGGIINTEVHDGTAYMEMSAAENKAVTPEQLILTADSPSSFAVRAKSATFEGDEVDYYYDANEIKNDNQELIATRTGFIYKRINKNLNIDVRIDWRNQRYRRWCLDLDSRTKFINEHIDVNTTRLGYQGKYLFTSASRRKEQLDPFYIGMTPEGTMMNLDGNAMKTKFQFNAEGLAIAKDYPVFPLDENLNPFKVSTFEVENLYQTVFLGNPSDGGSYINVNDVYSISKSTFYSNLFFYPHGSRLVIEEVIALDYIKIDGFNLELVECNFLSFSQINDSSNSFIQSSVFGTMVKNQRIDGYSNLPVAWWLFLFPNNMYIRDSAISGVLPYIYLENSRIIKSSLFFYHSFNNPYVQNDGEYQREVIKISASILSNVGLRITGLCDRISLNNMFFLDHNPNRANGLYLYDILTSVYSKQLKKNDATDALYYESMDADYNRTFTEISSQAANPIDLTVGITVDDAAPIVGDNVVFAITASNNLGNAATNVIVNSLLPAGYTYVSDDSAGSYDSVTGVWTVGDLAIEASDVINITATVEAAGSYQVDASISSNEVETNPADNSASITPVPVAPVNDLSATINVDNAAPAVGTNVVFTISGFNNGNKPATNVEAISLLPAGYTYVSDDGAGSYDSVTGIWAIGDLAVAASDVINITATVLATGSYKVDVEITGDEAEDLPVDNTDTITPVPTA